MTDIAATHSTTTYATVAESLNDVGTAQSFGHSNESSEELANYAHVRSETAPHDPLLAFSEAFAEQTFEADDFQFEASGQVHSNADILQVLTGNATSATSSGETYFMTEYHLTQAHDFIMDIELSTNESDGEFSFQLHDLTTDEMVLYWSGARGDRMRYEHCGTLLPGTYKMIIETQSDAGVATQAISDLGGFGEFDVYFRALNPHGEIIPVLHPSERRKPGVRYSDEVGNSGLIPGDSFELFHAENGVFVASVPEPSPATLLCVGMLIAFGLESGTSRRSRFRL